MFRVTHMQVEFLCSMVETISFPECPVWLDGGLHCNLDTFWLKPFTYSVNLYMNLNKVGGGGGVV